MTLIPSTRSLERSWTSEQKAAWIKSREEYRTQEKLDPLNELREKNPAEYQAALDTEAKALLGRLEKLTTKTFSWPIDKFPAATTLTPFAGTLHAPYNYKEEYGFHKIKFYVDQNLDAIVFNFYQEKVGTDYSGKNFVSQDSIHAQRHEYLGPSPHISGYQFDNDSRIATIEWYDDHLNELWIGKNRWKINIYYDSDVEGWVSKPRSSFSRMIDSEYMGLKI